MFSNFRLKKKWFFAIGAVILCLGLIAFTEVNHNQKRCRGIVVRIDDRDGQRFLTRRDVTGYLTNQGADPLVGDSYRALDFNRLEQRMLRHGLIRRCQISRDLTGNLIVAVEQPRPVARLVTTYSEARPVQGQYVSEEGRFFPISMNYSARVPLLSGSYFAARRSLASEKDGALLALLQHIQQDPFWRAQIAELAVEQDGQVTMWPQVGNHRIELGTPTDLEAKFKKLKLFYKHVLPYKGWDRYSRVNVQYRNQIVCE